MQVPSQQQIASLAGVPPERESDANGLDQNYVRHLDQSKE
jgi:hypothetical protein